MSVIIGSRESRVKDSAEECFERDLLGMMRDSKLSTLMRSYGMVGLENRAYRLERFVEKVS